MFVQIRAVKRDGFQGVWRAGRFWPSHEALRVQVVGEEPEPVSEDILDANGKKTGTRNVPNMEKIGKATLEDLKKDGRISVLADGETDASGSRAELEAARKAASRAGERVVELEGENAGLKETIEVLQARVAELESGAGAATEAESETHTKHGKHKK